MKTTLTFLALVTALSLSGCSSKPLDIVWYNERAKAAHESQSAEMQRWSSPGKFLIIVPGGITAELGLRSDGVVVWRKVK